MDRRTRKLIIVIDYMELTQKQEKELNRHLGLGRHTKPEADLMKSEMEKGKSIKEAHSAVVARRNKKKKMASVVLDGEKVEFKEGGLRNQLKVPKDYKFKLTELRRMAKVETGNTFNFLNKDRKMTPLLKKRINFAITLMTRKNKK